MGIATCREGSDQYELSWRRCERRRYGKRGIITLTHIDSPESASLEIGDIATDHLEAVVSGRGDVEISS